MTVRRLLWIGVLFVLASLPARPASANPDIWTSMSTRLLGSLSAAGSGTYDCAAGDVPGYETTADVGQWIDGTIYRWRELRLAGLGDRRCVEVTKPFSRVLTEREADVLLSASAFGLSPTAGNASVGDGMSTDLPDAALTATSLAARSGGDAVRGDVYGVDTRVRVTGAIAKSW